MLGTSKTSMSSQTSLTSCIKTRNKEKEFDVHTSFVKGVQTIFLTDYLPLLTTKPSSIKRTRTKLDGLGTCES